MSINKQPRYLREGQKPGKTQSRRASCHRPYSSRLMVDAQYVCLFGILSVSVCMYVAISPNSLESLPSPELVN
jgi:hypothetical protein